MRPGGGGKKRREKKKKNSRHPLECGSYENIRPSERKSIHVPDLPQNKKHANRRASKRDQTRGQPRCSPCDTFARGLRKRKGFVVEAGTVFSGERKMMVDGHEK